MVLNVKGNGVGLPIHRNEVVVRLIIQTSLFFHPKILPIWVDIGKVLYDIGKHKMTKPITNYTYKVTYVYCNNYFLRVMPYNDFIRLYIYIYHYKKKLNYRQNFIDGTLFVSKISLSMILSTNIICH